MCVFSIGSAQLHYVVSILLEFFLNNFIFDFITSLSWFWYSLLYPKNKMGFQVQIQHYIKVTQTDYVPVFSLVAVWISRSTCFHMCCAINFNMGSNINEVIKISFNLFIIFFLIRFHKYKKAPKKIKKH